MKWILLVLLAVNLSLGGYFYWQTTQPETIPATATPNSAQLNNLTLTASQQKRLNSKITAQPAVKNPTDEQCIRITGLVDGDSLPVVESRLKALEIIAKQESARQVIKQDFQVILGPFASVEEARAQLTIISARDIEGYVITSGPNSNSLSLGVFSNRENANRKLTELAGVNINATIYTKDHFAEAVILQIDRSSARLITDQKLQSILSSFKDADFLRYNCN